MRPESMVLVGLAALAGCATYHQDLATLPLGTAARIVPTPRSSKHIAVLAFEDLRGPEYTRSSPERYIPVVNLFHGARQTFYPEQTGLLRRERHGRVITAAGSLATAMPAMMQTMMQQMGLPDRVSVGAVEADADYVVTGRIVRTRFRVDRVPISHLVFGIFGVPFGSSRYDLEYEVTLYDARDRTTPIFTRTYAWNDRRVLGAYYNHEWAYRLFQGGLEQTLPQVVRDLADVIAGRG
jgi:hypothetical protein